jgi:hypothetical protein
MPIKISGTSIINDNRTVENYGITHNALGSRSGVTDINLELGNYISVTVTGTATFTFSNPLPSPNACGFVLQLTNGGDYSVVWPTSVRWAGGEAPELTGSGVDLLTFITNDGGTNWRGVVSSLDNK